MVYKGAGWCGSRPAIAKSIFGILGGGESHGFNRRAIPLPHHGNTSSSIRRPRGATWANEFNCIQSSGSVDQ